MQAWKLAAGMAVAASTATAGGIERTAQSVAPIFEEGNYFEFSVGSVQPEVSGTAGGIDSVDMAADYTQLGFAYKHQFSDQLSFALIYDQPFGADVAYPTGTGYPFAGATAELNTAALTGVLRYQLNDNFSVHGGLRYQTIDATIAIPILAGVGVGYTATGEKDGATGYLLGVAYEIPDIALRVALTYNSKIKHEINTPESWGGGAITREDITEVNTPQSVNLDFQTGIAKDTLLFGGVRWVDWSEFDITPAQFASAPPFGSGGSLVDYDDDTITYNIGVGRRFTEEFAGSISLSYEKSLGGFASNLGPTDGKLGVTIGGRYTMDNVTISGGINYTKIGDANTVATAAPTISDFSDNHAFGFGLKVGVTF
ncbi:MAG: outer membrane protein transport protein [Pseudomonadota bacterium]|nr:outer membrane protein transport protein [Pseudomonadota bacterium]